jgi:uncharacterized protein YndB with AHSA1/START domain
VAYGDPRHQLTDCRYRNACDSHGSIGAGGFGVRDDPNELARWWGPDGFSTPSLQLDARLGGSYRIQMRPPEGDAFYLIGKFRVVDPPTRLAYTFKWEDPDPEDVETVVDLSFRDRRVDGSGA